MGKTRRENRSSTNFVGPKSQTFVATSFLNAIREVSIGRVQSFNQRMVREYDPTPTYYDTSGLHHAVVTWSHAPQLCNASLCGWRDNFRRPTLCILCVLGKDMARRRVGKMNEIPNEMPNLK